MGLEQTKDCGCAERQARWNQKLPFRRKAVVNQPLVKVNSSTWTAPPEVPQGWELVDQCGQTLLFRKQDKYIVWDIEDGQYKRSHSFCCANEAGAHGVLEARCQPRSSTP